MHTQIGRERSCGRPLAEQSAALCPHSSTCRDAAASQCCRRLSQRGAAPAGCLGMDNQHIRNITNRSPHENRNSTWSCASPADARRVQSRKQSSINAQHASYNTKWRSAFELNASTPLVPCHLGLVCEPLFQSRGSNLPHKSTTSRNSFW